VRAAGDLEALLSLAGYAAEHPDDPFPELVPEGPRYEARAATHPLLPSARAVRNDVALSAEPALFVVSGSNMSGKSTLLRTVGVNAVLAFAGAPVRAEAMRISPLRVAASIQARDSLLEGASRFFAEIKRLKQVVDIAAGDTPALFLLDELLHGTNSHDRAAGAEGLVRGLLDRGAVGLVTTHDLALGQVADALAPKAENVHFEDHLEEGRMVFDYRLRPGVVKKSNALELMRAVGLEV
jgi:DNA mismatch repair ATPase MutS